MLKAVKIFLLVLIITQILSTQTFASTYGQSKYNCSKYQNGVCQTSGGSSNNSGSSTNAPVCSSQAPGSAPDLFQINTKGTNAIIYFAPSAKPYTNYFVSFGDGANSEGYGTGFTLSQSTGALKYDVFLLKPNTVYTFKVRAGNGCKAGPWSSNMTVKTGVKNSKVVTKYYPKKQAKIPVLNNIRNTVKNFLSPILPKK